MPAAGLKLTGMGWELIIQDSLGAVPSFLPRLSLLVLGIRPPPSEPVSHLQPTAFRNRRTWKSIDFGPTKTLAATETPGKLQLQSPQCLAYWQAIMMEATKSAMTARTKKIMMTPVKDLGDPGAGAGDVKRSLWAFQIFGDRGLPGQ